MSKPRPIPLADLTDELADSRAGLDDELADQLGELLPAEKLKKDLGHVSFGEAKSHSAPSSPVRPKPERQRWFTGTIQRHGSGRPRRMSRQLSRQFTRAGSVTAAQMRYVSQRTFSAVDPGDENPERGTWNSQIEFFLSCLGYAVGLGNVWRFPYLVFQNGGGAFLIPYMIALFVCGIPILFMELSLGQYSSEGPITVWRVSPLFTGIGIAMVMISLYLASYYNMVTGWAFYYFYQSLSPSLPWECCREDWTNCLTFSPNCPVENASSANASSNGTYSADFFFHREVLQMSESVSDVGSILPHLVIVLGIAWLVVFLVLMRGIKSFGKAVYFTSVFPYAILLTLLVRCAMEPGAANGIVYYLTPQWHRLLDPNVWGDAVGQIFFSTSICTGGVITLASYNRFHNNVFRDALVIGIGNSMTSIFSGFVVFSIIGFMAEKQNATIDSVISDGPGLTFIVYPQAVTLLPISPLWSALFFFMLIILALSSMFPTVENISTSIIDSFPGHLRPYKFWITFVTSCVCFAVGLTIATNGGMYVLMMLDKYAVSLGVMIIGLFQVVVLAWRYGADRIAKDVESMTGYKPGLIWIISWKYVSPILLLVVLGSSLANFKPLQYNDVQFPRWADAFGWFLAMTPLLAILLYAAYYILANRHRYKSNSTWFMLCDMTSPDASWGPAMPQNRENMLPQINSDDDVFAKA